MLIGQYELQNIAKVRRAQEGIGADASDEQLLVEYDRLGGLIVVTKNKKDHKVVTGSFYDVVKKQAREKPVVTYVDGWESSKELAKKALDERRRRKNRGKTQ